MVYNCVYNCDICCMLHTYVVVLALPVVDRVPDILGHIQKPTCRCVII
jgi:hypothetical protein